MNEPRTEAGRQLGSLVHQLAPTKTLPADDAIRVNAAIVKVEAEAVALDRAALVAAVEGLRTATGLIDGGNPFDSGFVAKKLVLALLNAPAAPTLDAAWQRVEAALPKYGHFSSLGYHHGKSHDSPVYYAQAHDSACNETYSEGPTPAAALNALADLLEAR